MPKSCTVKQAAVLADHGYDPDDFTFDEASEVITEIQENGWEPLDDDHPLAPSNIGRESSAGPRKPTKKRTTKGGAGNTPTRKKPSESREKKYDPNTCSPRQAAVLQRYNYDPGEFTFKEASDLIEELANNNWEPLEEDGVPNFS